MKRFRWLVGVLLIIISMGLTLVCTAKDVFTIHSKQQIEIPNHKIYVVGRGLFTKTILSAYKGEIYRVDDPKKIDSNSIIIFDSQELETLKAENILKEALINKNCWVISVGSHSSILIEKINKIGIDVVPDDEKSRIQFLAQFDHSPVVGFKLERNKNGEPYGSYFVSNSKDPKSIIEGIKVWVNRDLSRKVEVTSNSDWPIANQYTYYPLAEDDVGKINLAVLIRKPPQSLNNQYDYFIYQIIDQVVPKNGFWWRTTNIWTYHHVGSETTIIDYKPTTTSGTSSVTVSFSVEGITYSWTYSTPSVSIDDCGDKSKRRAAWYHNVDPYSNTAKHTYTIEPGVFVSVPKGEKTTAIGDYSVNFLYLGFLYNHILKPDFCPYYWAKN